jgi:hypothetical protein
MTAVKYFLDKEILCFRGFLTQETSAKNKIAPQIVKRTSLKKII